MRKEKAFAPILNPAGQPAPPLPLIAPAPRLRTLRAKRLMLFDNGKVGYGNSVAIFEKLHDLLLQRGAKEVLKVTRNAARCRRMKLPLI